MPWLPAPLSQTLSCEGRISMSKFNGSLHGTVSGLKVIFFSSFITFSSKLKWFSPTIYLHFFPHLFLGNLLKILRQLLNENNSAFKIVFLGLIKLDDFQCLKHCLLGYLYLLNVSSVAISGAVTFWFVQYYDNAFVCFLDLYVLI